MITFTGFLGLDFFYATAPQGARPQRIKVGAPESEKFIAWVSELPGARGVALDDPAPAAEYAGIPVDCISAESYPPTVE